MLDDLEELATRSLVDAVRETVEGDFIVELPQPGVVQLTPVAEPRRPVSVSLMPGGAVLAIGRFTIEQELDARHDGEEPDDRPTAIDWAVQTITELAAHGSYMRLPIMDLLIPSTSDEARWLAMSSTTVRHSSPW